MARATLSVVALVLGLLGVVGGAGLAAVLMLTSAARGERRARAELETALDTATTAIATLRRAASVVDSMQHGLYLAQLDDPADDSSLRVVAANAAAGVLSGARPSDLVGRPLDEALPGLRDHDLPGLLAEVARSGVRIALDNVSGAPAGLAGRVFSMQAFPVPDRSVGLFVEDVTQHARAEAALRHQALHDGLTGLPNRLLLLDRLQQAIQAARRSGTRVAVMLLDLDRFKEVNTTLGHHHGDLLLGQVARRLSIATTDIDTLARLGSDEFALVITEAEDQQQVLAASERVARSLEQPIMLDGLPVRAQCSVGIALFPEHALDADTLLKRADLALIEAKRSGRAVAVYRPEHDRFSLRRLRLVGELPNAIQTGQLMLWYQPHIALRAESALSAEALVRWQHPDLGLVGPDDFIEPAEVSGLIRPLTRWAIATAVEQCRQWDAAGLRLKVAVNVSARDFGDNDLTTYVADTLAAAGIEPARLALEITESQVMEDPRTAREVLTRLRDMGVRTCVDDFGTGYSSMSQLRRLPIHELKIDQSFVTTMAQNDSDLAIVRSIVDLGHHLGLEVVAEGVEDDTVLRLLAKIGCDRAQGFGVCPPVPADDLARWASNFTLPVIDLTREQGEPASKQAVGGP